MRKFFGSCAAAVLAFGLAGPAHAVLLPFSGTLTTIIGTLPAVTVVASGTANVTITGGNITSVTLAGGTFATTVVVPITDPAAAPITSVTVSSTNGAGTFSTIPGGNINNNFVTNLSGTGSGPMAVKGSSKVGLFGPPPLANLTVPFTSGGANGVGLGGNLVTAFNPLLGIGVSVRGAPWTTGTASVGTVTAMGFVTSNSIQLVSPTFISTTIGSSAVLPSMTVLTLSFVPEPGTLLLLGAGALGLVLVGSRKR